MDCSPPGFSVHGILPAKVLDWVAIPFSRGSPQPRDRPGSLALQADSLPPELPGKQLNTNATVLPRGLVSPSCSPGKAVS